MIENFSDHNIFHTQLFREFKIQNMLEFGLGQATEQFLREVPKVTSLEIYTDDKKAEETLKISGPQWAEKFKKEFNNPDWRVIMVRAGVGIMHAEYQVTGHSTSPRGANPEATAYLKEIDDIVASLTEPYDYVFVDAGIHLRGDIVNALFQRFPIIGAHDTNDRQIYGYERVKVPSNYQERRHLSGCGVTFWIKKHEVSSH